MEMKCLNDFLPNPIGLVLFFFNAFYFKIQVILRGEHSAQLLYDIDNLGFIFYFFLFQNSCDIEGEHSAQLVNDID